MSDPVAASPSGRAGHEPRPAVLAVPGTIHDADFILRRYLVTVRGWGEGVYLAKSRGRALADAWRSDAFAHYSFGQFLRLARCRIDRFQPEPSEITVLGKRALGLGHNGQYVQFVWPGKDVVLNSHPLDVLPESARPRCYRTAQAGETRRAETGTGSVHEHAVRSADAPEVQEAS